MSGNISVNNLVFETRYKDVGIVEYEAGDVFRVKSLTRNANMYSRDWDLINISSFVSNPEKCITDDEISMVMLMHPDIDESVLKLEQRRFKII